MKQLVFNPSDFSNADPNSGKPLSLFNNITKPGGLQSSLNNIIEIMLYFAGVLAFIALLYGSIQYLLAGGDAQKAEVAKKTILYSIVGVVLIIVIWAVIEFVARTAFKF